MTEDTYEHPPWEVVLDDDVVLGLNSYQDRAITTAVYPQSTKVMYPALGLVGEAGEVANKVKKIYRDSAGVVTPEKREELKAEIGDVLWYLAVLAEDLDVSLGEAGVENLKKLADRAARGKLKGSGDKR